MTSLITGTRVVPSNLKEAPTVELTHGAEGRPAWSGESSFHGYRDFRCSRDYLNCYLNANGCKKLLLHTQGPTSVAMVLFPFVGSLRKLRLGRHGPATSSRELVTPCARYGTKSFQDKNGFAKPPITTLSFRNRFC